MGKKAGKIKKTSKQFGEAYQKKMSELMDEATTIVKKMGE